MKNIVAEFLPIVLIFLFLSKNKEFYKFSRTIIGKLVALFMIIFYTSIDKILGLFVCGIIILFYQNDNIEGMDILDDNFHLEMGSPIIENPIEYSDIDIDDGLYISFQDINKKDKPKLKKTLLEKADARIETPIDKFRSDNCINNQLKYKNMNVKNEMAEHIYPEINFNNLVCNPCSKNCDISIVGEKINTELALRKEP
jgi:hypothetical protein